MKEVTQRKIFNYFLRNKIENFLGVPDSTFKYFIDEGLKRGKILITTREDEAIGIAVGMYLTNSLSVVFMQNAGFANSLSVITSLVQLYKIPLVFLIGWRGYLKNDAPEHSKLGKIQPELIQTLGLESKIITDENWKNCCNWALKKNKQKTPCALIVRRDFYD